jgi:hypothetical protein
MGKVLSLLIGTVAALFGLILLISWWYEFLFVVRGTLPVILVFAGVVAVIAGLSELKDTVKNKI